MKKQKGTNYYANRHSCFLLQYHLVVVTKNKKPVLVSPVKEALIELSKNLLTENWGCNVISINTDEDHIHILFEAPPQVSLSVLANNYKTVTSRRMRKLFPKELKPYLWGTQFWSDSYFVGSVSDKSLATVDSYIRNQGG